MSESLSVGLIGLGLMGGPIARNLLKAGFRLTILPGPRRTSIDDLVAVGAQEVSRASDLSSVCDVVLTVLPNSSDVENLVRGESGLLSAARQGFIHVDLTSGDPSVTRRIARLYRDQGFAFVDAGMSGMPEVAQAGELTLMVGVEDSAVMERLRPVLGSFARNVMRMGEPGAGHTTKLIIAFMGMAIANASAEILTLARAGGIDIHAIRELIGGTGMDSRTFQAMAMAAIDGDVSRRKLTIGNACKDMSQLVQMLDELGLATTVAPATLQALALASASGHSADYIPSLTRILCKMNGIETC